MEVIKVCQHCGKSFTASSYNKIYCSEKCKNTVAEMRLKRRTKAKTKHSISQILKLAKVEGLSYGQYVAKHNL